MEDENRIKERIFQKDMAELNKIRFLEDSPQLK
jgi:hypothetical protein